MHHGAESGLGAQGKSLRSGNAHLRGAAFLLVEWAIHAFLSDGTGAVLGAPHYPAD